jgi:hypothetical protein
MLTANPYTTVKKDKIIYWITTSIIVLLDSVMPALTFNTKLAKQGISIRIISGLNYPYLRLLVV